MSDISTKLTYLNTTKGKIKDVINMTNANIDNQTTFRNYAQALYDGYIDVLKDRDTLLDNMPKGTSTGIISEGLGLPAYECKMTKESTQEGTPTPENPVEVKTVKGYRNLFDINSPSTYYPENHLKYEIENDILTLEAIGTTGSQSVNYIFDGFDDTKNYTLSFKAKKLVAGTGNYARIQITIYGSNDGTNFTSIKSVSENAPVVNQEYSLNWTVSGYKYYRFLVYNDVSQPVQLGEKTQYYDIIFVEGNTVLPYVPYGTNYIYNKIIGFNIWDEEKEDGRLNTTDGSNIIDNTYYRSKNYILVDKNKTYYVYLGTNTNAWIGVAYYDKNKAFVSWGGGIVNKATFTPPNNCEYIRFYIAKTYYENICINISNDNLNGTYEAYKEKAITLPLNNNEICGIGNYKDELIIDKHGKCWLNKKIGKVVLNGQETWQSNLTSRFYTSLSDKMSASSIGLCNRFVVVNSTPSNNEVYFVYNSTSIYFQYNDITTIENWKTWLSNNNTIVYYVLAEENLIDLNYNVDLTLYEGINNISNSEDMDMSIKYIKDTYE